MGTARSRLADYGFFAALALAGLLFYRTIASVAVPVLVGAFAAVLTHPVKAWLATRLGHRPRAAAAITTAAVVLLVVVPVAAVGWLLARELAGVARGLGRLAGSGVVGLVDRLPLPADWRLALTPEQLGRLIDAAAAWSEQVMPRVAGAAARLLAAAFLFAVSLFYFLVDGARWLDEAVRLAPIRPSYVRAFFREFCGVAHALFHGNLVTGLLQGALCGVGYLLLGAPRPLLLAVATVVTSVTPIVGTAVTWLPAGLILVALGHPAQGVAIIVLGAVVALGTENVVKPLLMRGRMGLHPLMVFLSLFGGVAAFGAAGAFIGPLAAALFLTAVRIYDRDYRERLDPRAAASSLGTG